MVMISLEIFTILSTSISILLVGMELLLDVLHAQLVLNLTSNKMLVCTTVTTLPNHSIMTSRNKLNFINMKNVLNSANTNCIFITATPQCTNPLIYWIFNIMPLLLLFVHLFNLILILFKICEIFILFNTIYYIF